MQDRPLDEAGVRQEPDVRDVRLPDSKKQVAHLTKRLKMSAEQAKYVRAILADRDHQIEVIQQSGALPEDAKGGRITEILACSNDQIAAVLNSRQREKFDALLARLRGREQRNRERAADNQASPNPPKSEAD